MNDLWNINTMPYLWMGNCLPYSLMAGSSINEAYFIWVSDWVFWQFQCGKMIEKHCVTQL